MALALTPFLLFVMPFWLFFGLLTAIGSGRRGENVGRAAAYGFAFPATWVIWLVQDNHRDGRRAFRSR